MAWLLFLAAAACLALAIFAANSTGLVLLLLLAALGLLLLGAASLLGDRIGAGARSAVQMIDATEMRRLREQAEARRQASGP